MPWMRALHRSPFARSSSLVMPAKKHQNHCCHLPVSAASKTAAVSVSGRQRRTTRAVFERMAEVSGGATVPLMPAVPTVYGNFWAPSRGSHAAD
ncbi:MAG: hypothetical protein CM15mP89_1910 [Gammaproteobacteria bacterium]|nr:MAG: hypothetical protein CM15mP89_1910 [Gammaproteobacteria bacterium]